MTSNKIESMRVGGKLLHDLLDQAVAFVKPGVTGKELNLASEKAILSAGSVPAFKNYQGFPAALCVSINEGVVHGIPNDYAFKVGDIVSLDLGVRHFGYYTDSATTVIVTENGCQTINDINKLATKQGEKSLNKNQSLLWVTNQSLEKGISQVKAGATVGDIGHAVESFVKPYNFGVVRDLVGHGVGDEVHEKPHIPNFGQPHTGTALKEGDTIAIEPMITLGDYHVVTDADGWTIRTTDHSLAAHFEHTVLVTKGGYEVLT